MSADQAPMVLLPYQQDWLKDTAPVRVYEKSRRIGISWATAAEAALTAAAGKGMDIWYIGYNKDMAQEFIRDTAEWSRNYQHAASEIEEDVIEDEDKDILTYVIRYSSGYRVTALSSRPSNLRGKQGLVIIDEGAFHDDLEGLLKAALALIMWGGRVCIISTHNGDDNPFNDLIGDIRAGKKPYSLHRTTLDDALADGLYRRICLVRGLSWSHEAQASWRQELIDFYGDHADEELFCIPAHGAGVYLPRALVESCMNQDIPVLRLKCPQGFAELPEHIRQAEVRDWCDENIAPIIEGLDPNRATYFGEDFGRTGDITVIIPVQEQQNLSYRAVCAIELRNVPFRQQEQVLFYLIDRLPRFRGGALDARGNGQYLAEVAMQRYGAYRIFQVMLSVEWYRDNMPRYKAAFEDRTILLPRDADILEDHRAVRMDKGVARVPDNIRSKGTDGGQRHGDAAIAGALAIYAVNEAPGWEIEYQSTGVQRDFAGMAGYLH